MGVFLGGRVLSCSFPIYGSLLATSAALVKLFSLRIVSIKGTTEFITKSIGFFFLVPLPVVCDSIHICLGFCSDGQMEKKVIG